MTLPASGQLSLNDIKTELGASSTNVSLRAMSSTAGKTSPDAVSEFYGYSASTLKNGLLACWEMDETSGGTMVDSHSGARYGLITSVTINQTGKISRAYAFTGSSSYVSVPSYSGFTTNAGAIAVWFYYNSANVNLFCAGKADASLTYFLFRYISVRNGIELAWRLNGAGEVIPTLGTLSTGWHHVVLSSDGSTYRGYIDGSSVTVSMWAGGTNNGNWINDLSTDYLRIGSLYYGGWSYAACTQDQTAYWNRELTSTEVTSLWNSGNGLAFSSW